MYYSKIVNFDMIDWVILNRNYNMALGALERSTAFELMDEDQKQSMYEMIGAFGFEVFKQVVTPSVENTGG